VPQAVLMCFIKEVGSLFLSENKTSIFSLCFGSSQLKVSEGYSLYSYLGFGRYWSS